MTTVNRWPYRTDNPIHGNGCDVFYINGNCGFDGVSHTINGVYDPRVVFSCGISDANAQQTSAAALYDEKSSPSNQFQFFWKGIVIRNVPKTATSVVLNLWGVRQSAAAVAQIVRGIKGPVGAYPLTNLTKANTVDKRTTASTSFTVASAAMTLYTLDITAIAQECFADPGWDGHLMLYWGWESLAPVSCVAFTYQTALFNCAGWENTFEVGWQFFGINNGNNEYGDNTRNSPMLTVTYPASPVRGRAFNRGLNESFNQGFN